MPTELCVLPQMFNMHTYFILHSLKSFPALILSYIHLKDNQDEGEKEERKEWEREGFKENSIVGTQQESGYRELKERKKSQVTVSAPVNSEVRNCKLGKKEPGW